MLTGSMVMRYASTGQESESFFHPAWHMKSPLHLMKDVTPRVDDAVIHRADYFRLLFQEAPAACVVTDSACIVIDANCAAETILLWPLSLMREQPFQHMVGIADREIFDTMAADMLLHSFDASRPLCMKPLVGEEIDVLFKARTIRTPDGTPEFISWIFLETPGSGSAELL
jgi:PAS domain-containing protein